MTEVSGADPYRTLGVQRGASAEDLRKAYRRLAKEVHPDVNPGDAAAEQRFKDVSSAYQLLSDEERRARFDRGEIDASGAERPRQRHQRAGAGARRNANGFAGHNRGFADDGSGSGFANFDAEDFFSDFFGRTGSAPFPSRGRDVRYRLDVDFLDAVNGAAQRLSLPGGDTIEVNIPPGTRDGQILRLRGRGDPGPDGRRGDMLIEIEVRPHPSLTRRGENIHVEVAISLSEAVLGGRIKVPTPTGSATVRVPKWSNTGSTLRLKGKGVRRADGSRGDEYVKLRIMLPERPDPDLEAFVAAWPAGKSHHPWRTMTG
ncbi:MULTISPECIES: DnaJ C-terminal domain-containing protein [Rhodomicrobium]|uniref:DnaJ C-terminal domain-containing protein n=1 Tax=Rhodomicrobium TaxID=1068 RepID=UPI000B4BF645|nr:MULTISPECIES: DnaJ C-terminal domain-containing protein [Rhodomicrobium]